MEAEEKRKEEVREETGGEGRSADGLAGKRAGTTWTKVWMRSRRGTRAFHVAGVEASRGKVWVVGPPQNARCWRLLQAKPRSLGCVGTEER